MATGGRVFPSITGGGLTSAAQAFLDQQMANRVAAQRDRQIDIAERAQSLNQLTTLAGFLPPGTTVGDLGQAGMVLFGDAFGIDPAGLEGLELKPETFATALDQRRLDILDTPEFADLLLPSTRAALGLEPSADVAATRDLEAQMRFNALNDILRNPEFIAEFTQRALGREPIKLQIPGVSDEIEFESTTAANIYAQFLLAREQFGFRLQLEGEDPINKLIEETKSAVELAGQSVSSTALQRVFQVYDDAVENQDIAPITEFINDPSVTEGEKLGLQFLLGSIRAGEASFIETLPPQLRNFLLIGQAIREVVPAEDVPEIMQSITQALDPSFTATLRDPSIGDIFQGRLPFGGLRLEIGGQTIGSENPLTERPGLPSGGIDFSVVPERMLIEQIRESLADGSSSREELIGLVGEDLVNRAVPLEPLNPAVVEVMQVPEGGIQPSSVPPPFRPDVQRLNTLLRRLETTQGEVARQSLQNVIDRLRERIQVGMRGG